MNEVGWIKPGRPEYYLSWLTAIVCTVPHMRKRGSSVHTAKLARLLNEP
jgi:hypothetical protein